MWAVECVFDLQFLTRIERDTALLWRSTSEHFQNRPVGALDKFIAGESCDEEGGERGGEGVGVVG